jgi:hypothetical protein
LRNAFHRRCFIAESVDFSAPVRKTHIAQVVCGEASTFELSTRCAFNFEIITSDNRHKFGVATLNLLLLVSVVINLSI